ncbi:MAG: helix-turn-helix domain-containing protein [Gammaproteobacteria bacterium]|nr:helix-turn-helix domain-containing protein [Gammaproteobacteria bacterium]
MQLLKETTLPAAHVAERVGYAEPSAFHRTFLRWFSLIPGSVRQSGAAGR